MISLRRQRAVLERQVEPLPDVEQRLGQRINQYILDNLGETSKMAEFMTGDFRRRGGDPARAIRQMVEVM